MSFEIQEHEQKDMTIERLDNQHEHDLKINKPLLSHPHSMLIVAPKGAGKSTFIDEILSECGLINLTREERYPEVKLTDSPDFIFLSSEPFPFREKHLGQFINAFPKSKVLLVNGEMFSWYGSRLKDAPSYFEALFKKLTS